MDSKIFREAALAYQAVYDEELRQEIEEQQDFENWVNSLVEEGYDLSEYTWEDMYEAYLSEAGMDMFNTPAARAARQRQQQQAASNILSGNFGRSTARIAPQPTAARNPLTTPSPSTTAQRPVDVFRDKPQLRAARDAAGRDAVNRMFGLRPPTPPAGRAPTPSPTPPRNNGGSRPAPAAAPTARPASAPTAKPAPSSGQTGDKTKDMQTWAKANPSLAAKVKPGQSGYGAVQQARAATGGDAAAKSAGKLNTSAVTKTAFSSSTPALSKPLSTPSTPSTATPAAKPTPTPVKRPGGSVKPGSLVSGFDMFDAVKGYLIDEGFAETEEAATSIMANMSQEWRMEVIGEAEKWIQKAIKKPGALSKQLGVPENENIPSEKLTAAAKKGGKLGQRARLAQTLKKLN